MHGDKSTGPQTPEGRRRIGLAHFRHGWYTNEAIALRQEARKTRAALRELLKLARLKAARNQRSFTFQKLNFSPSWNWRAAKAAV